MKVINFSCKAILKALLEKRKKQTTRFVELHPAVGQVPLRFKRGELVQFMWNQRTSPKGAVFCANCGKQRLPTLKCACGSGYKVFPKILGESKIVDVKILEMGINKESNAGESGVAIRETKFMEIMHPEQVIQFSKEDGFETIQEFNDFFVPALEGYDIVKNPKTAIVYIWGDYDGT